MGLDFFEIIILKVLSPWFLRVFLGSSCLILLGSGTQEWWNDGKTPFQGNSRNLGWPHIHVELRAVTLSSFDSSRRWWNILKLQEIPWKEGILSRATLSLNPSSSGHLNIPKLLQHLDGFLPNPGKRGRIVGKGMIFLARLKNKLKKKKKGFGAGEGESKGTQRALGDIPGAGRIQWPPGNQNCSCAGIKKKKK